MGVLGWGWALMPLDAGRWRGWRAKSPAQLGRMEGVGMREEGAS